MRQTDHPLVRVTATTESRNPRTVDLDVVDTAEVLRLLNAEDALVPAAVAACVPELTVLVEATVERVRAGGRLHYVGAGTSGRVAVADAAELAPTYRLGSDVVVAHLAGGDAALRRAAEGIEDSAHEGAADIAGVSEADVVVGLTASGRTPYVEGALLAARVAGAFTALVSSNPTAPMAGLVDVHVAVDTGPEAVIGSTRMKAASAQKLVLNSLSTALAVALGRTYSNLMVDMVATNAKLRGRSVAILEQATERSEAECVDALDRADGEVKVALVSLLAGCDIADARERLARVGGVVRAAIR